MYALGDQSGKIIPRRGLNRVPAAQRNTLVRLMRRESVQNDARNGNVEAEVSMFFLRFKTSAPDGGAAMRAIIRLINIVSIAVVAMTCVWASVYLHSHW